MSALPGNPHAAHLEGYLDPRNSLEMMATLALAFEQRTTTLAILLLANRGGDAVLDQAREIAARLGEGPKP
ncbi:hypothetical protein [Arthrobacter sp. ok362]|uniref:hypothetical protein n=1 Tax=Arthrobacter sp. ok362 TaxID=1761745 RepID=UPI00088B3FEE|nr:hypothetical protein [Arthrobacter sp. ok362]SDK80915.1 hypothetical protein SAMN04487913_103249 [Arthrobacter sp. ok362]